MYGSAVAVAIACDVSVVDGDVEGQWWECVATAVVTGVMCGGVPVVPV